MKLNNQITHIEKPIFIVGAGRSGTTFLAKAMNEHHSITLLSENNHTWIWGNAFKKDDRLVESDLNQKIKKHIQEKFRQHLANSEKERICDKTPHNSLRIPFILAVFPDAKIIHIIRDGRAVMTSTKKIHLKKPKFKFLATVLLNESRHRLKNLSIMEWHILLPRLFRRVKFVIKKMLGKSSSISWGIRTPGLSEETSRLSFNVQLAKQWVETIKIATLDGRTVGAENYLEVRYEDLINSPEQEITRISKFADLTNPEPIIEFYNSRLDSSKNQNRMKQMTQDDLDEIKEIMEPTLSQLGYEW